MESRSNKENKVDITDEPETSAGHNQKSFRPLNPTSLNQSDRIKENKLTNSTGVVSAEPKPNRFVESPSKREGWAQCMNDMPEKCSPELTCLLCVDHIFVKPQDVETFKESNACCRQFRGADRAFVMHLLDNNNKEIISLRKPCLCCTNFLCIPNNIKVESPPGCPIGEFKESYGICYDVFDAKLSNLYGNSEVKVEKLIFQCLWEPVQFKVVNIKTNSVCGMLKKPWASRGTKWFNKDMELVGVSFPKSITVQTKLLLIAGCFLIDFMYY